MSVIYETKFSKNSFPTILLVISSYICLIICISSIFFIIFYIDYEILYFLNLFWFIIAALTLYFESYIHLSRSITFYDNILIYDRPSKLFFFKRKKIKIYYSDIDYYQFTTKGIIFHLKNKKFYIYIQNGINRKNEKNSIIELKTIAKIFTNNNIEKWLSNYETGYLNHFKAS